MKTVLMLGRGWRMAILLTNGNYYIAHNRTGAVIKVSDIEQAQDFYTIERAIAQKKKTPRKCASYHYIDTDKIEMIKEAGIRGKRKKSSNQKRLSVYQKTEGHCYLCGEFVEFDVFEMEHRIPVSKGGTNDLSNLFCSCHYCNQMKQDIYPADFMEKISQIVMYQMEKKYGNCFEWKVVQELLKMI